MGSGAGGYPKHRKNIEKLSESNFHVWKQNVEIVLAFNELNLHIGDSGAKPSASDKSEEWLKKDAKSKAIISLALSGDHLEHVRDCLTAASMRSTIIYLFQRKTSARRC